LQFAYQGRVISDAGNNVFFVGERGSWYPHVATLDEFATFELAFRWPKTLRLAATGKSLGESEEGEWRTGRWRSEVPVPVAGFNLGDYVQQTVDGGTFRVDVYGNSQLERALLQRFQRDSTVVSGLRPGPRSRGNDPVRPPLVIPPPPPPSPSALLKELGQDVTESVHFYEKFTGPFPFERLAVSPIPGGFGQGWPGLLYLSTLAFLPPEAHGRAGIEQRTQDLFLELMPFHEVAHQWWGNTVGSSNYHDQWIHEGMASYMALLYAESKNPDNHPLKTWLERWRSDLMKKGPEDSIADDSGPLSLGDRLRAAHHPGAYESILYGKGPWVFQMLRMMLREPAAKDPDARFAKFIGALVENYRHRALTNAGLQKAVEEVMTKSMDLDGNRKMEWFFDQWVHGTGIPRYKVQFEVRPKGEGFSVRGKLMQSGVPDSFVAVVPLYVPGATGKPVLLGMVESNGGETPFEFNTRVRPRRILIDPNLTLLCVSE